MTKYLSLLLACCILATSAFSQNVNPRGIAPSGSVFAMKRKGPVLYVGGGFNKVGVHTGGSATFEFDERLPDVRRAYVFGEVYVSVPDGQGGRFMGGKFDKVNGTTVSNLVHILPNETVDPNFAPTVDGEVWALAVFNDTIMFGGDFQNVNGIPRSNLASWSISQGSLTNWDPQADGAVYAIQILGGFAYVGGAFSRIGAYDQYSLAKINTQTAEPIFIPGTDGGTVYDMDVDQGVLYTVGNYSGTSGYYTGRVAEVQVGNDIPTYEFPAINGTVNAIVPDGNGGWYVGGNFFDVGDVPQRRLAHILPNYGVDPNFTPNPGGTVNTIKLVNDTLFFGGTFTTVDGISRLRLAAYDIAGNSLLPWNPGSNGTVSSMETYGDALLIGGSFSYLDSNFVAKLGLVSRLDGTALPLKSPVSGDIKTMVVSGDTLYAGGTFNGTIGFPTGRAARLTAEDSLPPLPFPEFAGTVETIIPDGSGGWFVGGSFFTVDNQPIRRLAHVLPDYTVDPNFAPNPNSTVDELYLVNDTLFIAGNFTQIGGQTRNRFASYDLGAGVLTNFNPDVNSRIYDMTAWNDTMMIVGQFTTVGGSTRERVAMVNKQTGSVLPFAPSFNGIVYSLAWNDTMMVFGGQFTSVAGQTRNRTARIIRSTGALSPVATSVNNIVRDMEIVDGILYMGGAFTQVDGQGRNRLASIDLTNQSVTAWNPDANNQVYSIAAWNDTMMIGGNFTLLGGLPQERAAKINRFTGVTYSFAPKPNSTVNKILVDGNEILIGGSFQATRTESRSRLFALDLGTVETLPLAPTINGSVEEILMWNDTMMLAGAFTTINGTSRQRLASLDPLTNQLGPLSMDIDNTVFSLTAWNDTMMFGGRFDVINGIPQTNLAAINQTTSTLLPWQPEPGSDVLAVSRAAGKNVVGGSFSTFKTRTRNRAMAIDMQNDRIFQWNPDLRGFIAPTANCLHIDTDAIYIGGRFTAMGDSSASNLGAVDKIAGMATGESIPIADEVWDVTTKGDSILFVGEFREVDGVFRQYGAGVNKNNWQLNNWQPELEDDGLFIENTGSNIFVGGKFFMTNSAERSNAYAINLFTQELLPWNPDPNNIIRDIETDEKGEKIYVAGSFSSIGGEPAGNFAALNGTTGNLIPGWDLDVNQTVDAVEVDPRTGNVYLGGRFSSVGGQTRNKLAVVDTTGSVLPINLNFDGDIFSMAWNDTMMYISGDFENIGGIGRNKIAAIGGNGNLMEWEPDHNTSQFSAMGDVVASPDKVFIQGGFDQVNGKARGRVAAVGPQKAVLDDWNPELSRGGGLFSVSSVYPVGEDVFVAGTFTEVRGTPVNGLARLNIETGVIQPPVIRFPFSTLYTFETFEDRLFIGGIYDSVDNSYQPNLASIKFRPRQFRERISEVQPSQGGNTGDVTLKIFGFGFKPGSRVVLRKQGFPDIYSLDSTNLVRSGREIRASFILRGEPLGMRDVYVEIPGDSAVFIENGFEIVQGEEPQVWIDLVGPNQVRNRVQTQYIVNYGNGSNIDAVGVPVWIVLPRRFRIESFSLKIARPRDSTQAFYDQVPRFFDVDTVGNEPFEGRAYAFIIPKIPANSSGQFTFRFRAFGIGPFQYKVWISKPMFGSPLKRLAGECIDEIITNVAGLVPGVGCALGIMEATLCPMLDYADPESGFGTGDYMIDYAAGLAETVATCALDATVVGGIVADIMKILIAAKNSGEIMEKCFDPYGEQDEDGGGGDVVSSFDPNDKIGLTGQGGLGWINTNQDFPYLINFENVDTATAAAQFVNIYDTLDTDVFDLSTLELKFFTIADSTYKIPAGLQSYERLVDIRPRLPMYVKFSAALDTMAGSMRWTFESIDPITLEPLNDPVLGFLPPNTDSISGTGAVFYSVRPYPNLAPGTTLENKADIVFDFNDPIITDPWINTSDDRIPQSEVLSLPDTTNSTFIPLSWTGSDEGAGIKHYNIFYSKNDEQYLMAAYQTGDTSLLFRAEPGASYKFYSVAYDTANNRERIPLMHDAETYVPFVVSNEPLLNNFDIKVIPNPNNGLFQLELIAPGEERVNVRILNMLGQEVFGSVYQLQEGENKEQLSLNLPSGIYHIQMRSKKGNMVRKVEIQ
ncbi:MAG: T9SS type A sorting domain-containing protein [Bacteroidota bacterium]